MDGDPLLTLSPMTLSLIVGAFVVMEAVVVHKLGRVWRVSGWWRGVGYVVSSKVDDAGEDLVEDLGK